LVEQYTPVVYRFCLRMMGNDQDARDATQDTLVKVLRYLHRYDRRWAFKTWAFTIARNTCLDEFRRRKRRSEVAETEAVSSEPLPADTVARRQLADHLTAALADIPPMYREVIVLHHLENRKFTEISEMLDIPMGTVMNRVFRARRRLRVAYEARQNAQMRERRYAWAAGQQ
jgi:RNA polymerase sigma-70 factor (ECF subfamily)